MIARPGKNIRQGQVCRNGRAALIIAPHSGWGSWIPKPKKLKLEILGMLLVKLKPKKVMISIMVLGMMWRRMIWIGPAPSAPWQPPDIQRSGLGNP